MSDLSESHYIERPILLMVSGGRNLARFRFPLRSQGIEARYCDELAERPYLNYAATTKARYFVRVSSMIQTANRLLEYLIGLRNGRRNIRDRFCRITRQHSHLFKILECLRKNGLFWDKT